MAGTRVSSRVAEQVAARAGLRCEYCRTPQAITGQAFHADHILPTSRDGQTVLHNLCLACPHCNLHKGDQIEALDPRTQRQLPLFNPRTQHWDEHFRWSVDYRRLIGRTATGRATVAALDLNTRALMRARMMWALLELIP
jgi:HNH endonuclease